MKIANTIALSVFLIVFGLFFMNALVGFSETKDLFSLALVIFWGWATRSIYRKLRAVPPKETASQ